MVYYEYLCFVLCDQGTYGTPCTTGTAWTLISGGLKQVDVGKDIVVGVNNNDEIFYRYGVTNNLPSGTSWVKLSGALKHVTVSPRGSIWGVNSADQVGCFVA